MPGRAVPSVLGPCPCGAVAGMKQGWPWCRDAVAVAMGLHVLPEQAPALQGGVCVELELWLSGSSSPEPGRRHRAMPAVPLG